MTTVITRQFCFGIIIGCLIVFFLSSMTVWKESMSAIQQHINLHMKEHTKGNYGNVTLAKTQSASPRVLIWVMTTPNTLNTKAQAVKDTWGKRADILLFISSQTNKSFPTIGVNTTEGREHLTAKTMQGFRYVYQNHFNDADWFMKADDDTYIIMENLKYFLSSKNPHDPVFFGHHFKAQTPQGYYSGGSGYVLSKEALLRLGTNGNDPKVCRQDGQDEDVEMGRCMYKLGVKTAKSTDSLGRSRFHCFDLNTHLFGTYHQWYYEYDSNGAKKGQDSMSDHAISFHYVTPEYMAQFEYLVYRLRPYGIKAVDQELNVRNPK